MKIKSQFILLSLMIISIPLFVTIFVVLHTYIHSPNRYLMHKASATATYERSLLPEDQAKNLENTLMLLAKDVEAIAYRTSDKIIIYSSMDEIKSGTYYEPEELWDFIVNNTDRYYFQFSNKKKIDSNLILITRIDRKLTNTEKRTKMYLTILLLIIILTIASLCIIIFIFRTLIKSLDKVESTSVRLAEGKLDEKIVSSNSCTDNNEIMMILKSLEKMRCELLEVQNRKNRFIMGISHDLRTPVAVIKGYSEAIKDGVITGKEEIVNTIELMQTKATLLEDMIDTLLSFMKLNDYEIKQKLEEASITDLIKDFAKYTEITGTIFKRKITTKIDLPKNICVPLNKQLVQRSFENIFNNAVRYTKNDGIIEIESYIQESQDAENNDSDKDNSEEKKGEIILKIQDNGSGIEKKDLPNIFDMFYRGTNSRREEGMGIGLSVVKNIIDTHGWKISVDSKKNKGTCFTIEIPYLQ